MDENALSDEQLLWLDAAETLEGQGAPQNLVAMIRGCSCVELTDGKLVVEAPNAFSHRKLLRQADLISQALSQAAFEPMEVVFSDIHGGPAPAVSSPSPAVEKADGPTGSGAPANPVTTATDIPLDTEGVSTSPAVGVPPTFGQDASIEEEVPPKETIEAPAGPSAPPIDWTGTSISPEQFRAYQARLAGKGTQAKEVTEIKTARGGDLEVRASKSIPNPLVEEVAASDALLTFETFVEAPENLLALDAAKIVANGETDKYNNPLFIYGGSGLGKTHLLRAIQNYIAENDPERTCVYRVSSDFINDYVSATRSEGGLVDTLTRNYKGVDVLIIDDIQQLMGKAGTIRFFFDVFNDLVRRGKQVVLAADEPPVQLGFDDRDLSRMGMGAVVSIQAPTLEFKRILAHTFYERMKADGGEGMDGTISNELLDRIGDRSGNNIRLIRAFVLDCLLKASALGRKGLEITGEDIDEIAATRFEPAWRRVSPEDIQRAVQKRFNVSHEDLVSQKRSKEIAQPRHIAIYLTRELTGLTLKEIGAHFGGRSHPTVKSSIAWVENHMKDDRILYDKVRVIRESLGG